MDEPSPVNILRNEIRRRFSLVVIFREIIFRFHRNAVYFDRNVDRLYTQTGAQFVPRYHSIYPINAIGLRRWSSRVRYENLCRRMAIKTG